MPGAQTVEIATSRARLLSKPPSLCDDICQRITRRQQCGNLKYSSLADHDAVLAEGEAPEEVRFWLHVKREIKDVRHAIEELRDLLNEVPREGQCSELTPGK